jgi:hypothetical protein
MRQSGVPAGHRHGESRHIVGPTSSWTDRTLASTASHGPLPLAEGITEDIPVPYYYTTRAGT